MPAARYGMAAGYWNGKIYLVGGVGGGIAQAQTWEYDPLADSWNTTRIAAPAPRFTPGGAVIAGHLYVAGGRDASGNITNTLYDYDIANNSWTTHAPLPTAVNAAGAVNVNGQLWVIGGGNPFGPVREGQAPVSSFSITQIYDPGRTTGTPAPR